MNNTLYVTDLDGTLLNNGSFVSDRSAEIISGLTTNGALITVATARTPATVVPLLAATETDVPYVVLTGAATFDPVDMVYLSGRSIPRSDCALLNRLFAQAHINPFIYRFLNNRYLTVYHDRSMTEQEYSFYEERANLELKHFTFEPQSDPDVEAVLYFAIGHEENIRALADEIARTGRYSVSCYPDIYAVGIYMLEVFTAGVSKADAVADMQQHVGADRLVVFGDNLNDIPMFEIADVAVAVANAQPRVRDAADIVIGPNFDDSVARFIHDDFYGITL